MFSAEPVLYASGCSDFNVWHKLKFLKRVRDISSDIIKPYCLNNWKLVKPAVACVSEKCSETIIPKPPTKVGDNIFARENYYVQYMNR